MKFTCGLTFTLPLVLLLLAVAAKGHTVIQCYVCDNCAQVDKNTPLEQCGGENFTTTTTSSTPTTMSPTKSTSTSSTEAPSTTQKNELPSPPTVGPISSTTGLPTPPSLEEHNMSHDHMNHSLPANSTSNLTLTTPPSIFVTPSEDIFSSTTELDEDLLLGNATFNQTNPSAILVRQRRHTEFNGITYHCYKIQKKYGNVFGTKRGCIGVKTEESACDELDAANNNQTQKCSPCTTTKCNGSSTLGVSIGTLLVALIALTFKA